MANVFGVLFLIVFLGGIFWSLSYDNAISTHKLMRKLLVWLFLSIILGILAVLVP